LCDFSHTLLVWHAMSWNVERNIWIHQAVQLFVRIMRTGPCSGISRECFSVFDTRWIFALFSRLFRLS